MTEPHVEFAFDIEGTTNLELLRGLRHEGFKLADHRPIRQFDVLKQAKVKFISDPETDELIDLVVTVGIVTFTVVEKAREWVLTEKRTVYLTWYRDVEHLDEEIWYLVDEFTWPDPDFVEVCISKSGRIRTPEEHRSRQIYEADCHRPGDWKGLVGPGASRQPMDSFTRTMDAYAAPKMEKHWAKNYFTTGKQG